MYPFDHVTYVDDNYEEGQNNVIVGQRADLTNLVSTFIKRISSSMKMMVMGVSTRTALIL
ncbi:hypothetical protein OH492_18935 [Vibrio chagasii]|nr:hypothetical protein [Vibrio chagasii]